jgi:glycosyltransferase involved in cell wall biosynthesis
MTVAVLEPHASGHRAYYVRWIADSLRAAGRTPLVGGGPELLAHPVVAELLAGQGVESVCLDAAVVSAHQRTNRISMIKRQFAYRTYFERLFKLASADHAVGDVIIPYVDYCLYAFALRGAPFQSSRWCGITMRTSPPGTGVNDIFRWRLIDRMCAAPKLARLFTIDPMFQAGDAAARHKLPAKLAYLADPVERIERGDRTASRKAYGVDDWTHVVLVFGSLDQRKGIEWLLEALLRLPKTAGITAMLVGQQTPELRAQLQEPRWRPLYASARILSVDRVISQSELGGVLAAADSAWLGYVGHEYASGVFNLAAVHGLPIIATAAGAIGLMASRVSRVISVNPTDSGEVARALRALARGPRQLRDATECERLQAAHSVSGFGATISAALEQVPGDT